MEHERRHSWSEVCVFGWFFLLAGAGLVELHDACEAGVKRNAALRRIPPQGPLRITRAPSCPTATCRDTEVASPNRSSSFFSSTTTTSSGPGLTASCSAWGDCPAHQSPGRDASAEQPVGRRACQASGTVWWFVARALDLTDSIKKTTARAHLPHRARNISFHCCPRRGPDGQPRGQNQEPA
jgi:hypothetical protein